MGHAVGIIANPASGKDIRRLVAHGSTFDNNEKVNIVRRVLLALDSMGIASVYYMPDTYGIVPRAASGIDVQLEIHQLDMPVFGTSGDSREAATHLDHLGVDVVVTLGGDGTNRVVASAAKMTPILPVSTGTNNVFPQMVEGTLAGLAAGAVAMGAAASAVSQRPRLNVFIDGELMDIALVDVVLSSQRWTGSRAFWKAEHVQEIVLSHIPRAAIGVCGLGPILYPAEIEHNYGVYIRIEEHSARVRCAIGPGLVTELPIGESSLLSTGSLQPFRSGPGTLALDGEREIELRGEEKIAIQLASDGPLVVDVREAMYDASRAGLFRV